MPEVVDQLLDALKGDDWSAAEKAIADIEAAGAWQAAIMAIVGMSKPHAAISAGFHRLWTARGHRIREQVAADEALLDALRVPLPAYDGPALRLYRGENAERVEQACGFAWTTEEETARMFASGLQASYGEGGVLLATGAPANAIIAGPSPHSLYLGEHEYVVDRRKLPRIEVLKRFPRI